MKKTWKPTTAGILSIVAGALSTIGGVMIALIAGAIAGGLRGYPMWPHMPLWIPIPIIAGAAIPVMLLGIVAIIGGTYALKRRKWGLALAGAICALFGPWFVLGILAIIFVVMGKAEFEQCACCE